VNTATTVAIVPVKTLGEAKRRLAPALAPAQRRRLVLTMLEDVLGLLGQVDAIARILVVTPDADVASIATARGAVVVGEERCGGDLNAAVRLGLAYARSQGADRALVVPADVPLATHAEMLSVLTSVSDDPARQVAIVPSADGEGTNALLLAPPDVLRPEFGEGSFVRHVAQAVALGLDFRVLRLPGLGTDIDQPRDLARLAAATAGSDRYSFLDTAANEGSRQEPSR
jgi:2-phospho-L-lactate/phosphoenolpyruvate guanylyltransferase